jgi:transketolase
MEPAPFMDMVMNRNSFDVAAARARCMRHRRRILDVSQTVSALHGGAAFSCLEMVDCIQYGLMRRNLDGSSPDRFVLSKGHGAMALYAVLEARGVLNQRDLDTYCHPEGRLGCHPDYGLPGIEASTGSLGHGMALSTGMAYAEQKIEKGAGVIYVVLSDGEFQEGSTWESIMMAANLGIDNLVAMLDHNGFQSYGRTSETHPAFYPIREKAEAFGWETVEVNGHDAAAVYDATLRRKGGRPFLLIGNTVKGRGVSYMENVPIWHYRSPSREEYTQALAELAEVSS